jgi:hypothetical protein
VRCCPDERREARFGFDPDEMHWTRHGRDPARREPLDSARSPLRVIGPASDPAIWRDRVDYGSTIGRPNVTFAG